LFVNQVEEKEGEAISCKRELLRHLNKYIMSIFKGFKKFAMPKFDWSNVFLILVIGLVSYLVLGPLLLLIVGSFTSGRPGDFTSFSLDNYVQAYYNPKTLEFFFNSLAFAAGSMSIGLSLAIIFAWLIERTNTPFRDIAYVMVISPMAIPGMLLSIAWVFLLSSRIGIFNQILIKIFGLSHAPFNIFSLYGMIFVEGLRLVPTTFLLLVGAFRSMDPALEEAAYAAGANTIAVTFRITLRVLMPSILVAGIYIFMTAIEAFEIPGILGLPARIFVFSSRIYYATHAGGIPEYGIANSLAITYLALSVLLIWIYQKKTRHVERFATITGKAYRPRLIDLGRWKYLGLAFFIVYFLLTVLFPLLILVWASLLPFYQVPSKEALSFLSLKTYQEIVGSFQVQNAIKNTLILMVQSTIITTSLAVIVAWVVVRSKFIGRRFLDILTFLPHAIPSIVIGLALTYVYLTLDFIPIYATRWILLVALVTKYMAFSTRTVNAAILQIHKELEEAAKVSGASWRKILLKITVPLMLPTLIGVAIWVAVHAMRELSMCLMLNSPGNTVLSVLVWVNWDGGNSRVATGLGVLLIFAVITLTLIGRLIGRRFSVR
jgi:iron(III) transport system permease protein